VTTRKKLARLFVRLLLAAFAVVVAISYRRPPTRTAHVKEEVAPSLASETPEGSRDRMRFRGFDYVETRADEGTYRLRASEAVGYEERGEPRFRLKDVVFESQESGPGHTVTITAPRAEFAQRSRAVRIFDGVRIAGEGTTLNGASFLYEPVSRIFRSEGPVQAARGALVGSAEKGHLQTRDGLLVLRGRVRMRGRVESGRALDLRAPLVKMGRDGTLRAEDGVVVRTDEAVLRSRLFERLPEGGGDRLRAQGKAWVLLAEETAGPRGRTPIVAEGETVELTRDAGGLPLYLELLGTDGEARLSVAPSATTGARRIVSARFESHFRAGKLADIAAPGAVQSVEASPRGGAPGSGLKTLTAGKARITFAADGRTLDVAALEGAVVVTDGTRATLRAAHGTLRGSDDSAVFTGEPGAPADYRDERGAVTARSISYLRRQDIIEAVGDVHATYSGPRRTELLGGGVGEPLFSESESLRMAIGEQKLTLRGNVRAWQGDNVLRGGMVEMNDGTRTLHAEDKVQAFFRRRVATSPSGVKTGTDTVNASGELLNYRETDRVARIEKNTKVVSGSWAIEADQTEFRLAPDRSVEYAEARGSVRLEDRAVHRRGEGDKAMWRPQSEVVSLEGSPAVAIDGKGNRLTGAVLTFRQGKSRVEVEGSGSVGSEATLKPQGTS